MSGIWRDPAWNIDWRSGNGGSRVQQFSRAPIRYVLKWPFEQVSQYWKQHVFRGIGYMAAGVAAPNMWTTPFLWWKGFSLLMTGGKVPYDKIRHSKIAQPLTRLDQPGTVLGNGDSHRVYRERPGDFGRIPEATIRNLGLDPTVVRPAEEALLPAAMVSDPVASGMRSRSRITETPAGDGPQQLRVTIPDPREVATPRFEGGGSRRTRSAEMTPSM